MATRACCLQPRAGAHPDGQRCPAEEAAQQRPLVAPRPYQRPPSSRSVPTQARSRGQSCLTAGRRPWPARRAGPAPARSESSSPAHLWAGGRQGGAAYVGWRRGRAGRQRTAVALPLVETLVGGLAKRSLRGSCGQLRNRVRSWAVHDFQPLWLDRLAGEGLGSAGPAPLRHHQASMGQHFSGQRANELN